MALCIPVPPAHMQVRTPVPPASAPFMSVVPPVNSAREPVNTCQGFLIGRGEVEQSFLYMGLKNAAFDNHAVRDIMTRASKPILISRSRRLVEPEGYHQIHWQNFLDRHREYKVELRGINIELGEQTYHIYTTDPAMGVPRGGEACFDYAELLTAPRDRLYIKMGDGSTGGSLSAAVNAAGSWSALYAWSHSKCGGRPDQVLCNENPNPQVGDVYFMLSRRSEGSILDWWRSILNAHAAAIINVNGNCVVTLEDNCNTRSKLFYEYSLSSEPGHRCGNLKTFYEVHEPYLTANHTKLFKKMFGFWGYKESDVNMIVLVPRPEHR